MKEAHLILAERENKLKIENEQRKKAMDNQAKMIQDLKKERDELAEKLRRQECINDMKAKTIEELVFENRTNKKTIVQLREILEKRSYIYE